MVKYSNLLFVISVCFFMSCSGRFKDYESNWIMTKFEIEGVSLLDQVMSPNFSINVKRKIARLPALFDEVARDPSEIKFSSHGGKDFVEISGHPLFSDEYEIKCLDDPCCVVSMASSKIYLELCYNGDIPYGVTRNCPCKENAIRFWLN